MKSPKNKFILGMPEERFLFRCLYNNNFHRTHILWSKKASYLGYVLTWDMFPTLSFTEIVLYSLERWFYRMSPKFLRKQWIPLKTEKVLNPKAVEHVFDIKFFVVCIFGDLYSNSSLLFKIIEVFEKSEIFFTFYLDFFFVLT